VRVQDGYFTLRAVARPPLAVSSNRYEKEAYAAVDAPPTTWDGPRAAFEAAHDHEGREKWAEQEETIQRKRKMEHSDYQPSWATPPVLTLYMPILSLFPVGYRAREHFALGLPG